MSENLEKLLLQTRDKSQEAAAYLTCLIKKLLLILSLVDHLPHTLRLLAKNLNTISEWYDSQKEPNGDLHKLMQEHIDETNPRRPLTAEEQRRLSKLEAIAAKLNRGETVQNR